MTALALFSGGCDSLIAMKLLTLQGINVKAVHFNIGFGGNKDKSEYLRKAAAQVGAELVLVDIRKQFFDNVLFTPKYGYGKYFNPCIDCHANMFAQAFLRLEEFGASFVVSGEVLGQRPKSQRKEALDQVRKLVRDLGNDPRFSHLLDSSPMDSSSLDSSSPESKPRFLDELLLRPMSAKLLEPSFPERAGWVDRERLLDVSGRGRSRQLEMVKSWGWEHYENPGGGCLLTDLSVAQKLKDLSAHRKMVLEDIELVKVGRYMILPGGARLIIGRNEQENAKLSTPNPRMLQITLLDSIGPVSVVESNASEADKLLAAQCTLAYAKPHEQKQSLADSSPESTQANLGAPDIAPKAQRVKVGDEILHVTPIQKERAHEFLFFKA